MNYKKRACSILNWPQWRFERWRVWPCFCFSFSVSSLLCFIIIVSLSSPHLMGWLSLHTSLQPLRVRCCSRRSASHLCCNIRLEWYFTHTHTHTRALNPAAHKYVPPKATNCFRAHSSTNQNSSTATHECNIHCTCITVKWSITQSNFDISTSGNKRGALLGVPCGCTSNVKRSSILLSFKNGLIWGRGVKLAFDRLSLQYGSFPLNPSIRSLICMTFVIFRCMLVSSLFSFARGHIFCWSHRKTTKSFFFSPHQWKTPTVCFSLWKNAPTRYLSTTTVPLSETFSYSEPVAAHSFSNRRVCRDGDWCSSPWLRPCCSASLMDTLGSLDASCSQWIMQWFHWVSANHFAVLP